MKQKKNKYIVKIIRGCEVKKTIRHLLTPFIVSEIIVSYPVNALRGCRNKKEAMELQTLINQNGGDSILLRRKECL